MTQPIPPIPPERARVIAEIEQIEDMIREGGRAKPRISMSDSAILNQRRKELLAKYFAMLPVVTLSRCPHCKEPLKGSFDSWGFDGPWWQESRAVFKQPPAGCEHFRVLTGAVVLPETPVRGGSKPAHLGGDAPFVIPKVLAHPTMNAVIASLPMTQGVRAFPIAYFSVEPPSTPGLANPWTSTSCTFTLPDGSTSFSYKTDPWDFDLTYYLARGVVKWIDPSAPGMAIANKSPAEYPFVFPARPHFQLVIRGDHLERLPPPNNEVINPFGD